MGGAVAVTAEVLRDTCAWYPKAPKPVHKASVTTLSCLRNLLERNGGAMGIRTPDLLIANETLYQLSYDPTSEGAPYLGHQALRGKRKPGRRAGR